MAGKNLNRSVWSKLRPGDSSFFPYGLASPARADFIGVPRGRGWVRESGVAGCSNWQSHPPKGFSSRRSLLVSPLSNYHQSLRRGSAAIQRTPWHADRRSAQGWRRQTKGESRKRTEESLLSSGRFRLSPATGVARATSSLKPAAFPSTTQVLCYFLH